MSWPFALFANLCAFASIVRFGRIVSIEPPLLNCGEMAFPHDCSLPRRSEPVPLSLSMRIPLSHAVQDLRRPQCLRIDGYSVNTNGTPDPGNHVKPFRQVHFLRRKYNNTRPDPIFSSVHPEKVTGLGPPHRFVLILVILLVLVSKQTPSPSLQLIPASLRFWIFNAKIAKTSQRPQSGRCLGPLRSSRTFAPLRQ